MLTIELTEQGFNKRIIGKDVYDINMRYIGFVRTIILRFPPVRLYLLVQRDNYSLEIPFEEIRRLTDNNVQLNIDINSKDLENLSISSLKELMRKDELLTHCLNELEFFIELKDKIHDD